jgi:hypothetical protein
MSGCGRRVGQREGLHRRLSARTHDSSDQLTQCIGLSSAGLDATVGYDQSKSSWSRLCWRIRSLQSQQSSMTRLQITTHAGYMRAAKCGRSSRDGAGQAVKAYEVSICHACNHGCIPVLPSADADARSDKGRVGLGQRVACRVWGVSTVSPRSMGVYLYIRAVEVQMDAASRGLGTSVAVDKSTIGDFAGLAVSICQVHAFTTYPRAAVFKSSRSDDIMFAEADEHTLARSGGHGEVSSRWGC